MTLNNNRIVALRLAMEICEDRTHKAVLVAAQDILEWLEAGATEE